MFSILRKRQLNRSKLYIAFTISIILIILTIFIDNLLYNKTEIFTLSEAYTQSPTKVISDIKTSVLSEPTNIAINGIVTKKVNPAIIKKGFFNYSFCYVFHGNISIGDYEFNFDDNKPLISTIVTIDDKTVIFASPVEREILKINDNVYRVGITLVRDLDFNLTNLQMTLYNIDNQQLVDYSYEF